MFEMRKGSCFALKRNSNLSPYCYRLKIRDLRCLLHKKPSEISCFHCLALNLGLYFFIRWFVRKMIGKLVTNYLLIRGFLLLLCCLTALYQPFIHRFSGRRHSSSQRNCRNFPRRVPVRPPLGPGFPLQWPHAWFSVGTHIKRVIKRVIRRVIRRVIM